jgi:isopentenyl-diphosphate delta-isomerase
MEKSLVDVIDENLQVLAQEDKAIVHAKGLLHQAVRALLINSSQKILLVERKRSDWLPLGHLELTVSTDILVGETAEQAILREFLSDLGLAFEGLPLTCLGQVEECKVFRKNKGIDNTISQVFLIKKDVKASAIHINSEEIENVLWLNYADFVKKFFTVNCGGLKLANRKKVYYTLFQALGIPSLR